MSLVAACSVTGIAVVPANDTDQNVSPGQALLSETEVYCPDGFVTDLLCIDCFTIGFCDGTGNSVLMTCPAATPYCKNNACSAERDLTWDLCDEQIMDQQLSCSAEGFFPDPLDCHQYHFCPDPSVKPVQARTTYACPENYVFDSINLNCKKNLLNKYCYTMECTAASTFVTYPGNANYYGFCKTAGATPVMFKCSPGHYFNLEKLGCEFRCTGQGYFAGPKCNQSYLCYKSGTQLVARLETCPVGYKWSKSIGTCERDTTGTCVY